MSTILDALRKSKEAPPKDAATAEPRREILSNRSHDYLATVSSPVEDRLRLLRWLIAGVVVVAVLLVVLLAVVLTRGGGLRNVPSSAERSTPVESGNVGAPPAAPLAAASLLVAATPAAAAPTASALATASSVPTPAPRPQSPTAELRLVVVSGTPEPASAPSPRASSALTTVPGAAAAGSTLPPPLTGVSADDLPQPVPLTPGSVLVAPARAAAGASEPPRNDPASIMAAMKLDGIIFDKRDPVAMINGRMLRPGGMVGSARVVKILPDSVILRIDGQEVSLGQ